MEDHPYLERERGKQKDRKMVSRRKEKTEKVRERWRERSNLNKGEKRS